MLWVYLDLTLPIATFVKAKESLTRISYQYSDLISSGVLITGIYSIVGLFVLIATLVEYVF